MIYSRLTLSKQGLWLDTKGNVLDIRLLPETYLLNILKYCDSVLAGYIWDELDYRANPTPKWLRRMFYADSI